MKLKKSIKEEIKLILIISISAIISGFVLYLISCPIFGVGYFEKESINQAIISILATIIGGLVVLNHKGYRNNKSALDNFGAIMDKLFIFQDEKALQIFDSFDNKFAPIILNKFLKFYSSKTNIKYPDIEITHYSETLTELGNLSEDVFYAIVGGNNSPHWFFNDEDLNQDYKLKYLSTTNRFSKNITNAKRIMVFSKSSFIESLKLMKYKQFNDFMKLHSNIDLYWCNKDNECLKTNMTEVQRDILNSDLGVFDNKLELSFTVRENGIKKISGEMQISNESGGNIENIKSVFENNNILKLFENKSKIKQLYKNLHNL